MAHFLPYCSQRIQKMPILFTTSIYTLSFLRPVAIALVISLVFILKLSIFFLLCFLIFIIRAFRLFALSISNYMSIAKTRWGMLFFSRQLNSSQSGLKSHMLYIQIIINLDALSYFNTKRSFTLITVFVIQCNKFPLPCSY